MAPHWDAFCHGQLYDVDIFNLQGLISAAEVQTGLASSLSLFYTNFDQISFTHILQEEQNQLINAYTSESIGKVMCSV